MRGFRRSSLLASMAAQCCKCCSKDVDCPHRRQLRSSATQVVMQTLQSIFIESRCDESTGVNDGFICRACFRLLGRYKKLKDEVIGTVAKTLPVMGVRHSVMPSCSTSPPVAASGDGQHSQAISSPSVSVSIMNVLNVLYTKIICILFLQATIHYKSVAKSFKVTPSRRKICKPLIRRNFQSFSIKCFENVVTRKAIRQEVAAICSDNYSTVMRDKNSEALIEIDFAKIIEEMEMKSQYNMKSNKHTITYMGL